MRKVILIVLAVGSIASLAVAASEKGGSEAQVRARSQEFVASWNRHDPKAMAGVWASDGDLINPFGRMAKGRNEVEKLLTEEQSGVMKGTTFTVMDMTVRMLKPDVALAEWDIEIAGMHAPDGSPIPTQKMHVNNVMVKKAGEWWTVAARPVSYLLLPGTPHPK
jgi:uncharacterized protein (TIGR02246 family)